MNIKLLTNFLIALSLLTFSLLGHAGSVKTGEFTGASDHITTGKVSIVTTPDGYAVVLGADFSLDGAPDPKVGFGKNGKYDTNTQMGKLISKTGEQAYIVPASVKIKDYNEVYIWCEKFSVPLGVASIK